VRRRHFIVRANSANEYETREVSAEVAQGVHQFVSTVGRCAAGDAEEWMFYFLHMNLSAQQADQVARDITARMVNEGC